MAGGYVKEGLSLAAGDIKGAYRILKAEHKAREELRDGLKDVFWRLERDKLGGVLYEPLIEAVLMPLADPRGTYSVSLGEGLDDYLRWVCRAVS